ncbi:peroxisomal acyl-coenzyme A thioester hydrolase 1 [[Candida] jaroonii]|uniref:Peroxisomal acyl-coenzyme A thioester hydrolase 1 n=1 Tax=[Candida] jaroonii TaxID=467808 RepID=A0ACA9Y1R6_9ASCO|nr:peroxisomal acyl-coenzyme A thioester hydrolase 1 [[Candida] jaroonii]
MSVETSGISNTEKNLGITKIGDNEFRGIKPLSKPSPNSRGVYGGNLCGQSIIAAMETVPEGFVPHSLHSYFIAAGEDTVPCDYKIEELSNGKNFANRLVRVSQNNQLKYMVMISLTKRNSIKLTKNNFEKNDKNMRPFEYQLPPGSSFFEHKDTVEKLPYFNYNSVNKNTILQHKLTPEFSTIDDSEFDKTPGERQLSFFIKLNDQSLPTSYRYGSMGLVTDSLYLTSVSRILHLPTKDGKTLGSSGGVNHNFFSVSLDHSIYFHDDDFDPTNWLYFMYQSPRFSNNRVLFTGGYYNDKGKLIASIAQEGLVFFKNDADLRARL